MVKVMLTVKAPGKLYLAGEYAIVEPGYHALLVTLDQFIYADICPGEKHYQVTSAQYPAEQLTWKNQAPVSDNFKFVLQAIKVVQQFLTTQGQTLPYFKLHLRSDLNSRKQQKYGLGSSAAVTVATIKALVAFTDLNLTNEIIFKLAALTHYQVQQNGSLGDVAASTYTGWVYYQSFDRAWLIKQLAEQEISELVAMPWPKLQIKAFTPKNIELLIGWTSKPANTKELVDQIKLIKQAHPDQYQNFLQVSEQATNQLYDALLKGDYPKVVQTTTTLSNNLKQLGGAIIITPLLQQLISCGQKLSLAAKSSGAGGGDCGICLIQQNDQQKKQLLNCWRQHGITPLNLKVYQTNERNELHRHEK